MYLDALFGQFPSQNGLQCRVSDAQLASPSFTLPINRRDSRRFLSNLTLVLCSSVYHVCLQRPQVLQVTLTGMCPKYGEIYLLIVGTIRQTLTVINVAVLRALVTEVLGPTKEQNVAHLVKNTVRFFEIPALCPASSEWHVVFEKFQQLH
jgi:hypothetical protein